MQKQMKFKMMGGSGSLGVEGANVSLRGNSNLNSIPTKRKLPSAKTQNKGINNNIPTRNPFQKSKTAQSLNINNERRSPNASKICMRSNCSVPTLISLVPQQPVPSLIQNPRVSEDPLLVNGLTTVFQVNGTPAQKCLDGVILCEQNGPIYQIIPNTHAHITHYVIVDSEEEMLQKTKNNDHLSVKRCINEHRKSAEQLLNNIIQCTMDKETVVQNPNVNPAVQVPLSVKVPANNTFIPSNAPLLIRNASVAEKPSPASNASSSIPKNCTSVSSSKNKKFVF